MTPDYQTDAEIVRRVLNGERELFEALVNRHGAALLGYLKRQTADFESAREAFQEAWIQAFESLQTLRDAHRFRGWLFAIAVNALRREKRYTQREEPLAQATEVPGEHEPLRRMLARELRDALESAISELPARQHEVFRLRTIGDLTHAEIARLLGISEETARANYYQAVRRLRDKLTQLHPPAKTR